MPRHDVLHHVRRLERVIDGQAMLGRVVVGEDRARLQGHAGVTAEAEAVLDHRGCAFERAVHVADLELALEGQVVAELGMDHRGGRVERARHVGDRGQLLELHREPLQRVLGCAPRARDHGCDRLALPAGALHGERILWRRLDALEVRQHADPGLADLGDLGPGHHPDHAGAARRRIALDGLDPRMRERAAPEGNVRHARQHDIVDELAAAVQQPARIRPRHGAADVAVRPVEHRDGAATACVPLLTPRPPPCRAGRDRRDRIDDRLITGAPAVVAR